MSDIVRFVPVFVLDCAFFSSLRIGDSPVAFLDEPTSGMDPSSRRELWALLLKIRDTGISADHGCSTASKDLLRHEIFGKILGILGNIREYLDILGYIGDCLIN